MLAALGQPSLLALVITERCNARCSYCFQDRLGRAEMSRAVISATIRKFFAHGRPGVHFFGGEPLLRKDFIRQCIDDYSLAGCSRYEITTNGSLLDEQIVDILFKFDFKVNVSIDGGEHAQRLRYNCSPPDNRPISMLLERFSRKPLHVQANVTVNKNNYQYLTESVQHLVELGFRRISVSPGLPETPFEQDDGAEIVAAFARLGQYSQQLYRREGWTPLYQLDKPLSAPSCNCSVVTGKTYSILPNGDAFTCMLTGTWKRNREWLQKYKIFNILDEQSSHTDARRHCEQLLGKHARYTGSGAPCPVARQNGTPAELVLFDKWNECLEAYQSFVPIRTNVSTNRRRTTP